MSIAHAEPLAPASAPAEDLSQQEDSPPQSTICDPATNPQIPPVILDQALAGKIDNPWHWIAKNAPEASTFTIPDEISSGKSGKITWFHFSSENLPRNSNSVFAFFDEHHRLITNAEIITNDDLPLKIIELPRHGLAYTYFYLWWGTGLHISMYNLAMLLQNKDGSWTHTQTLSSYREGYIGEWAASDVMNNLFPSTYKNTGDEQMLAVYLKYNFRLINNRPFLTRSATITLR